MTRTPPWRVMASMEAVIETPAKAAADGRCATCADDWRRLFREVAAGRMAALEALFDKASRELYGLALWRTGCREDASDVVQEVFLRVVQRRRDLERVRDPRVWLLAVTRRAAVDLVRRRAVRRHEPLEGGALLVAGEDDAERRAEAARASALVASLPVRQREAVYLRHHAGCSFAEMGRVLGVPTFTAASRYRLGIANLRRKLGVEP